MPATGLVMPKKMAMLTEKKKSNVNVYVSHYWSHGWLPLLIWLLVLVCVCIPVFFIDDIVNLVWSISTPIMELFK
jgi:hypothetical protein